MILLMLEIPRVFSLKLATFFINKQAFTFSHKQDCRTVAHLCICKKKIELIKLLHILHINQLNYCIY